MRPIKAGEHDSPIPLRGINHPLLVFSHGLGRAWNDPQGLIKQAKIPLEKEKRREEISGSSFTQRPRGKIKGQSDGQAPDCPFLCCLSLSLAGQYWENPAHHFPTGSE